MTNVRENQTVEIDGGQRFGLAVYGAEDGLPVFALHGAPASRYMFDVADEPARQMGLTLYCVDRPGYGLSPMDEVPSLASRADTLIKVADALRLENFILLGVSGGSPYAVAMAARLGARILSLGLVSPIGPVAELVDGQHQTQIATGHRWFFLSLPKQTWLLSLGGAAVLMGFRTSSQSSSWLFRSFLGGEDKRILSHPVYKASKIRMTREAMRQGIKGGVADLKIFSQPWNVDYHAIGAPSLLWQGTADRVVPPAVALKLGSLLPNCEVSPQLGAGHFWVYENVGEVLGGIKRLVQQPGDRVVSAP